MERVWEWVWAVLLRGWVYVLWPGLFPLVGGILPLIFPPLRERKRFEEKNLSDPHAVSFAREAKAAYAAFEVSSEGELEQIKPILVELLDAGHLVELVYCSISVEKNCENLARKFPEKLRVLRLPLLVWSPLSARSVSKWLTAKTFILCRYDFFPELLVYGRRKDVRFLLVSATLKNQIRVLSKKRGLRFHYLKFLYGSFDFLVAATQADQNHLAELSLPPRKLMTFDFRIIQISRRLEEGLTTLSSRPFFGALKDHLENFPRQNRIIFGSSWPLEARVFSHPEFQKAILSREVQVTICPHQLEESSLKELIQEISLAASGLIPVYLVNGDPANDSRSFSQCQSSSGIVILALKGVLCELYAHYHAAFVGGGHGRSIHSVLEPALAGAMVFVGPKVHRSTEYDFIRENFPGEVHVVEDLENFFPLYLKTRKVQGNGNGNGNRNALARQNLLRASLEIHRQFMEKTLGGLHVEK